MPISNPRGSVLHVAETEVFSGVAPTAWTDLDLSGTIGGKASLVLLKLIGASIDTHAMAMRKNGDTDEFYDAAATRPAGCALIVGLNNKGLVLLVATDPAGIIEWRMSNADTVTVDVMGYIN